MGVVVIARVMPAKPNPSTSLITLREALDDVELLGNTLSGSSWAAWRTILIGAMGEPLTESERVRFKDLTARDREPERPVEELVLVVGRRGGKSRAISVLATYIAALIDHSSTLVRGERGVLLVVAQDQRQADVCLDYVDANFQSSPVLRQLVEARTQRTLRLTNNITIEVRSCDFRRLRGPTYICCICDELAFWRNENSSNPDDEVLAAIRPGLATTHGQLFMISSPYARRGVLWSTYKQHFGANGDPLILVAQAPSLMMNPSLSPRVVARAYERDPTSAAAEYDAQFRRDIEAFVSTEVIEACTQDGIHELPRAGQRPFAFIDPSGGSADSMTLAIGHAERAGRNGSTVVIDLIREVRPPFSPSQVVDTFAEILGQWHVSRVVGDRYGGEWCREPFAKRGIRYEISEKPKSDLYGELLPLLNSTQIKLLDDHRLATQLLGLERRTSRSGKDTIDHGPGGHDDIANVVAGVASIALNKGGLKKISPALLAWAKTPGYTGIIPTRSERPPQQAVRAAAFELQDTYQAFLQRASRRT